MRSRPRLTVRLSPARPAPGKRLRVLATFDSQSETPFDAIEFLLTGRESRFSHHRSNGKTTTRSYHRRLTVQLQASFPGGILEPGQIERTVDFDLPAHVPPSYESLYSTTEYELSVRVRIPWWPDRHETYNLKVLPVEAPAAPLTPRLFTTEAGEHRGKEPVIELSLDRDHLAPGGTLAGAVAITGLGDRRLRRIELSLCAIETALVRSSAGPAEVARQTWILHEGTPGEGASLPFKLALPESTTPTFSTQFFRVDNAMDVTAVVAFGRDIELRVPVVIARQTGGGDEQRAVPLLGRARQVEVFREALAAARSSGLPLVEGSPEEARAVMEVRGLRATIAEEHREDLGVCLVADIDWPALGLDLRVSERRWSTLKTRLRGVDQALQKRFTVEAREAAQAAAVLTPGVCEALIAFDEVALDDGGAVALRKGGVYKLAGLRRLFGAVHLLASRLSVAMAAIPPPAALAHALPAYQRFAEKNGASLRVGDLSLDNLVSQGVRLSLAHRFDDATPVESCLWVALPRAHDASGLIEALSEATGHTALIEQNRLGLRLPVCDDPESIVGIAEQLASEIAHLSGVGAGGPYR